MKRQFRVSTLILLISFSALALCVIRDRSNRIEREKLTRLEIKYRTVAKELRTQMESCLAMPSGTPYVVKPRERYDINGQTRPIKSWTEEAEFCRKMEDLWMRSADSVFVQEQGFQRRLILPF